MEHVQKRFCNENLLFLTIMLQWQDFLIKNGYWGNTVKENTNCRLVNIDGNDNIILPYSVPISPIVYNLSKSSDSNTLNSSDEANVFRFDIFIPCFASLYQEYIEMGKAPLEINISYEQRQKIQKFYYKIFDKKKFDKDMREIIHTPIIDFELFWKLWHELVAACDEVIAMLITVLVTYDKNQIANNNISYNDHHDKQPGAGLNNFGNNINFDNMNVGGNIDVQTLEMIAMANVGVNYNNFGNVNIDGELQLQQGESTLDVDINVDDEEDQNAAPASMVDYQNDFDNLKGVKRDDPQMTDVADDSQTQTKG